MPRLNTIQERNQEDCKKELCLCVPSHGYKKSNMERLCISHLSQEERENEVQTLDLKTSTRLTVVKPSTGQGHMHPAPWLTHADRARPSSAWHPKVCFRHYPSPSLGRQPSPWGMGQENELRTLFWNSVLGQLPLRLCNR